jgi:myo-inositol-1(or 4)-monophosphatase
MTKRKDILIKVIKEVGLLLLHQTKEFKLKEGVGNYVTATDLASENILISTINNYFPKDLILSEETNSSNNSRLLQSNSWIIDPLDGTNNYKFNRAMSVVSVAYAEKGELKLGAVYNPFRDELFFAEKGKGAFLNGEKISVSEVKNLSKTSFATDNCYDADESAYNLKMTLRIKPLPWVSMRGCAALTMCEVACGRFDVYFNSHLMPWDNAAGFLIVKEAGGITLNKQGKRSHFMDNYVLVGNKTLVNECHRLFSQ